MTADIVTEAVDLTRTADFSLGGLFVRPSLREVQGHGPPERLEPRVMQALVALSERPGAVVSRDRLIDRCWDGRIVGDDAINRCMTKLRRVGGASGAFAIEAISKVGYRLIVTADPDVQHPPRLRWLRRRGLAVALTALLAAGAVGIGWWIWPRGLTAQSPFVVTSFRALTGDEASRVFAATAADDVASALAQHHLPTQSQLVGPRLEISGLVDGDGARLHARVRITDSASRTTIWTSDFTASAADAATLRTRIAGRVTAASQIAQETLRSRSHDFDAVSLSLAVQGADGVETNSWVTLTTAERLVQRSPDSGPAHAAFGGNLLVVSVLGPPEQAEATRARAIEESRRALQLDPDGYLARIDLMWATDATQWANREHQLASAPGADSYWGKLARGALMLNSGRIEAGLALVGQAVDGHEISGLAAPLAEAQRLAGKPDQAAATLHSRLLLRPNDEFSRRLRLDLAASTAEPAATLDLLNDPTQRPAALSAVGLEAYRSVARWKTTHTARDGAVARTAILAAAKTGAMARVSAAPLLTQLGDLDGAFAVAEAYAKDPRTRYSAMFFDPTFLFLPETAPMRSDPRFMAIARALGLVDYWRSSGKWPDFCLSEPHSTCALMMAS